MGKFEDEPFRQGTMAVAEAMASAKGTTVVGGGETAEAVEQFGLAGKTMHKVDEHVPLADLAALVRIYARILARYFA